MRRCKPCETSRFSARRLLPSRLRRSTFLPEEGSFSTLLGNDLPGIHSPVNQGANRRKIMIHTSIRDAEHFNSRRLQKLCSHPIIFHRVHLVMLHAIKFHHKQSFMTKEIDNIAANRLLALEANRKIVQKLIPEPSFLLCHGLSEFLGSGNHVLVVIKRQNLLTPKSHSFSCAAHISLPPGGRWHGSAVTEGALGHKPVFSYRSSDILKV